MPGPPYSHDMTGRSNHRKNWLGQLVLQVEYTVRLGHGGKPQPGQPTYIEVLKWRDASPSDLRRLDWFAQKAISPAPQDKAA